MGRAPTSIPWSLLYILDGFAIALFAVSYYRNCYLRGYRLDFWHTNLFLLCILPNMIMLPFARSELNGIVLGNDMDAVIAVLPIIFLITLLGYLAVLAGGGLWRLQSGVGMRNAALRVMDVVPRCSMMVMSSRSVLMFQSGLCFSLQLVILGIYFSQSGFGFNLRSFTFANPTYRPVALLISNYSIIIASHCLARYTDSKERSLLACTLLLTFGLVFFGARSSLLSIYIGVLLCYLVKLRGRVSILKIVSLVAVIILVGFYLGNVRAGQYSPAEFFASFLFLLFYGENFADLRDFAWVYSAWDHVFWAGKTYLAASISFIPRFASQFRDTWGLGAVTSSMVGFDPQLHPGLRPGAFGESFFNFGLFGVVAVGLILGVVSRRVDTDVKRALAAPQPSMRKAFASSMLLTVTGSVAVSAGFSGLYVLAGIYFFSWSCLCVQRMFRPARILIDHADNPQE
jgi:oligosaccharide repeat unit polymerase